jgi:cold shock protein
VIGVVKLWKTDKGFGFIKRNGDGEDIFFHASAVKLAGLPEPKVGDRYSFEISTNGEGRTRAVDLRRAE